MRKKLFKGLIGSGFGTSGKVFAGGSAISGLMGL